MIPFDFHCPTRIIFGPGKLPDLGRGLGKGVREFKDAIRGGLGSDEKKPEEKKA